MAAVTGATCCSNSATTVPGEKRLLRCTDAERMLISERLNTA